MNEIEILQEKAELVQSNEYKKVRNFQIEMILDLSTSEIEGNDIKAMLKLIKKTDNWAAEYEKKLLKNKQ